MKKPTGRGGPGRGQGRKPQYGEPTVKTFVRLPESLARKIDAQAEVSGISRSERMVQILRAGV